MRNLFHGKIHFLIAPEGFFQTSSQNKSRKIPLYFAEGLRIWRVVSNFGDHHSEPGTKVIRQLSGANLKQGASQMKFPSNTKIIYLFAATIILAPAPNQKSAKGQAPRTGAFRSADTVVIKPSKKQITGEWGGTGILGQENAKWPPIWVTATFKSDGTVIDHVSKNKFVGKWEIKENFLLVRYSHNVQPGVVMRSVAQLQLSRFSYMAGPGEDKGEGHFLEGTCTTTIHVLETNEVIPYMKTKVRLHRSNSEPE